MLTLPVVGEFAEEHLSVCPRESVVTAKEKLPLVGIKETIKDPACLPATKKYPAKERQNKLVWDVHWLDSKPVAPPRAWLEMSERPHATTVTTLPPVIGIFRATTEEVKCVANDIAPDTVAICCCRIAPPAAAKKGARSDPDGTVSDQPLLF